MKHHQCTLAEWISDKILNGSFRLISSEFEI